MKDDRVDGEKIKNIFFIRYEKPQFSALYCLLLVNHKHQSTLSRGFHHENFQPAPGRNLTIFLA